MLQPATLQFLKDLKKHNEKSWFESNRKRYEAAKKDFEGFVEDTLSRTKKIDATIAHLQTKDCIFRINRDIRFSKDKSPYKTNFGMYISRQGKQGIAPGYYFQCEPGNSFLAGGLWQPMREELARARQEIDYNWKDFQKILNAKKFKDNFGSLRRNEEDLLMRPPKGYEADNPAIEFLKLKSFVVYKHFSDEDILSRNFGKTLLAQFEALKPMIDFFAAAIID